MFRTPAGVRCLNVCWRSYKKLLGCELWQSLLFMNCERGLQSHSITLLSAHMQENLEIQGKKVCISTTSPSHQRATKRAFSLVWKHLCGQKSTHKEKGVGRERGLSWETICHLPAHLSSITCSDTGSPVWEGVVK